MNRNVRAGVSPASVGNADGTEPLALARSMGRRDACPTLGAAPVPGTDACAKAKGGSSQPAPEPFPRLRLHLGVEFVWRVVKPRAALLRRAGFFVTGVELVEAGAHAVE